MQRFFVTPVLDRGKKYWLANFPAERKPWSRKAAGRKQKKFTKREAAESFLEQAKREWTRRGGVSLGLDREAHYDFMRAMAVIADIPNGTLEKATLVYRMCRSAKELRGSGYEAPIQRKVELSPRIFLACQNEARKRGISGSEAIEGMMGGWLMTEAGRQAAERGRAEALEYEELVKRNKLTRWTLAERKKEEEMARLLGEQNWAFEEGRRAAIAEQRQRRNEWRRKRKERSSNGNSDLP
jgi:hypothetical protein